MSDHNNIIDTYHNWYLDKFGFEPLIDGSDARSVKITIIPYLKKVSKDGIDIKNSFNFILSKYDQWGEFNKKNTRLRQIASGLHNIIQSIKDGNKKNKPTNGVVS